MKVPKLLRRRQGDLAYVYYQRKKIYFGKWNSKEADEAYRAFVMKLASGFVPDADKVCEPTVAEIVLAFFTAKKDYYVKNGKQTRQLGRFKYAVEFPLKLYAQLPAKEFGPRKLVECRDAMLESGRFSRKYLNVLVTCLRQIFKYAVEYEMIPPDVLTALQAVAPLKKGRTAAREVLPVRPVPPNVVDATCAELTRVVADMVRVQRLTGNETRRNMLDARLRRQTGETRRDMDLRTALR